MRFRLPTGGLIDREHVLHFEFNGQQFTGYSGDTLASALLAHGVHHVGSSWKYGRPRGITAAGVEEASALVQVSTPFAEPMQTASTVELYDGLVAHALAGQGALGIEPDPARYDARYAHCEVLVIGAGPAGLAAAREAAATGVRVIVLDEQSRPGGSSLARAAADGGLTAGGVEPDDDATDSAAVAALWAELGDRPRVRRLLRTTAFGYYGDGFVLALEKRGDHLAADDPARQQRARQRIWRIRTQRLVLATGAHERPIVFTDNDRPGIMLAEAARVYLNRYAVLVGRQIVLFGSHDGCYDAALDLARAGATVTVIDPREEIAPSLSAACADAGVTLRPASVVVGTDGVERVEAVQVSGTDPSARTGTTRIACDCLLVSGGWTPAVQLFSHAGGRLRYDETLGAFVPAGDLADVEVVGAAAGGVPSMSGTSGIGESESNSLVMWRVATAPGSSTDTEFVDRQRDVTTADILRATGAGLRSVEHVKRYTTAGTAHDQGKTSALITSGITADALGVGVAELGVTSFRPPYVPVGFGALAGRNVGALADPSRLSPLHEWHVAAGARFENVGQWRRPWYYPRHDETMAQTLERECRAARTGVAMMDASTLGKIDVQGPDAPIFLDRLYTNLISTLTVGMVRYGVMCGVDGMVIDDGTVLRVTPEQFLVTTTTGNAAMILDWMQEWLQTEWPDLRVTLTSVTEQWATIPVVGPRSREVVAAVCRDLDVSNEAFGFMACRATEIDGVPVRVARISFSGELAYEVNVDARYALGIWRAIYDAGQPLGITPYGTETMHVLRAEKGYPIVGQDTDGTVTPQDLGMAWVVSKKKADFIGKRSHARADNHRTDRKQLVGLLSVDGQTRLTEGAALLTDRESRAILGHVTSSSPSVALARPIALALLRAGRERIGQRLLAYHDGGVTEVMVTSPVHYDPEGQRRDG